MPVWRRRQREEEEEEVEADPDGRERLVTDSVGADCNIEHVQPPAVLRIEDDDDDDDDDDDEETTTH